MVSFILRYFVVLINENVLVDSFDIPEITDPRQLTDAELSSFCLQSYSFVSLKTPVIFLAIFYTDFKFLRNKTVIIKFK